MYNGEALNDNTIRYLIPLNKHILEPLGFEAVYDEYTSDMYFQRDIEGYRVRTTPIGARIIIIDLKYLHTLVDANGESLNELEHFFQTLGIPYESIFTQEALDGINSFGQQYYEYYEEHEKFMSCSITLILGLVLSLLFAWPVQLLWNWLLPRLLNLPEITFLQAWGLELLCGMLLGGRITFNNKRNS